MFNREVVLANLPFCNESKQTKKCKLKIFQKQYIYILIKFSIQSMSNSQEIQSQPYQPTYAGILSINDYEQVPETQNGQNQQLPFDEIESILAQSNTITNRRESVLILAVNYLQDRCTQLTNTNNYLHLRMQDLMEEINYHNEVEINQQTAHNFLEIMQKEIEIYKQEFHLYRERCLTLKREVDEDNGRLNLKIQELTETIARNQQQKDRVYEQKNDLLLNNEDLSEINAELNDRVEDLEEELATLRNQSKYYRSSPRSHNNRRIDGSIQVQLESLIEKLMHQLEIERNQKIKLSHEYKLLQKQVLELEKELTQKNSKICQLEMSSLRSNRLSPPAFKKDAGRVMNGNHYQLTRKASEPVKKNDSMRRQKQNANFKTFSLMTLLNQDAQFNKRTRLIIALKVIEFYLRKIKKGEFTTQMLENLLVHNYSSLYPQACIIRKDKHLTSEEGECSQERLIWNLGFILDNLVNQAEDESQPKTQAEVELTHLINNILEENTSSLNDVDDLKMYVEQAIRLKK